MQTLVVGSVMFLVVFKRKLISEEVKAVKLAKARHEKRKSMDLTNTNMAATLNASLAASSNRLPVINSRHTSISFPVAPRANNFLGSKNNPGMYGVWFICGVWFITGVHGVYVGCMVWSGCVLYVVQVWWCMVYRCMVWGGMSGVYVNMVVYGVMYDTCVNTRCIYAVAVSDQYVTYSVLCTTLPTNTCSTTVLVAMMAWAYYVV